MNQMSHLKRPKQSIVTKRKKSPTLLEYKKSFPDHLLPPKEIDHNSFVP